MFWDLTLGEIRDIVNVLYDKKQEEENRILDSMKAIAVMNEVHATQITERIAALFSSDTTITPLYRYFPMWFHEEAENDELTVYKAQMENYAFWHNERQVKIHGRNDASRT